MIDEKKLISLLSHETCPGLGVSAFDLGSDRKGYFVGYNEALEDVIEMIKGMPKIERERVYK